MCSEAMQKRGQLKMTKVISIVFLGLLGSGLCLIIRDTLRGSGAFGLRFKPLICPGCNRRVTLLAKTTTPFLKRTMGFWICPYCGCEMDHYGKKVKKK